MNNLIKLSQYDKIPEPLIYAQSTLISKTFSCDNTRRTLDDDTRKIETHKFYESQQKKWLK